MTSRSKIHFSPNCPPSLRQAYRRAGSCQKLADQLGINVSHVYKALTEGKEPANREIARLLGFDPMRFGDRRTRHMRWWDRLTGQQKHKLIFDWFHYREDKADK